MILHADVDAAGPSGHALGRRVERNFHRQGSVRREHPQQPVAADVDPIHGADGNRAGFPHAGWPLAGLPIGDQGRIDGRRLGGSGGSVAVAADIHAKDGGQADADRGGGNGPGQHARPRDALPTVHGAGSSATSRHTMRVKSRRINRPATKAIGPQLAAPPSSTWARPSGS